MGMFQDITLHSLLIHGFWPGNNRFNRRYNWLTNTAENLCGSERKHWTGALLYSCICTMVKLKQLFFCPSVQNHFGMPNIIQYTQYTLTKAICTRHVHVHFDWYSVFFYYYSVFGAAQTAGGQQAEILLLCT